MNQPSSIRYFFLGANTKNGFYSLYDEFACEPDDTLHIIKSGPGTGKSTFMKRIGTAAESQGLDVEYILCSGDPHSLDGVYIPAIHQGWVDGTSPHVLEPKCFGLDGTYVDLGIFCNTQFLRHQQSQIKTVTSAYRLCYQKAYMYLQAAGNLNEAPMQIDPHIAERIRSRASAKLKKELNGFKGSSARPVKRFLRANSCIGNYPLPQTLNTMCDRLCIPESAVGLEALFFDEILLEAAAKGIFYIHCLNPLSPEHTDAVLFPDLKLGFISAQAVSSYQGKVRTIHLDSYLEEKDKSEYKQLEKLKYQLMDAAYNQLSRAKRYHDELETYYRPALDVAALDAYTESVLKTYFS